MGQSYYVILSLKRWFPTVMDTIAVGMSIGAWGRYMYSIFLFLYVGDWMVEYVVGVTIYLLPDYYAYYSGFYFFVSDSWDFPDPSYFIFNL